jgi:Uma2 family endonuclease
MTRINDKNLTYGEALLLNLPSPHYELIDGMLVAMAGVSALHKRITMAISSFLYSFWQGIKSQKLEYEILHAPFDVVLFPDSVDIKLSKVVVQPDLGICKSDKISKDNKCIIGVPEFLIEVTSSNISYDFRTKYDLYERARVPEYWIIVPKEKTIYQYILEGEKYSDPKIYIDGEQEEIKTVHFDFSMRLEDIFDYEGLSY